MKCQLNPNVRNISGKSGQMLFKTFTKRDGSKETRLYILPKRRGGGYGYERTNKPSDAEIDNRILFAKSAEYYKSLTPEQLQDYRDQFAADKFKFNGKRYNTLRGYIVAKFFAEHKGAKATLKTLS